MSREERKSQLTGMMEQELAKLMRLTEGMERQLTQRGVIEFRDFEDTNEQVRIIGMLMARRCELDLLY